MSNFEHVLKHVGIHLYQHHKREISGALGAAGTTALAFAKSTLVPFIIANAPVIATGAAVTAVSYGGYKVVKSLLDK